MKYRVCVDDNFHFMDESERYELGEFESQEEALAAAKDIVDRGLETVYKPGMSAEELFGNYTMFGEDPFIVPEDSEFSAWEYARKRCFQICSNKD